ncbi:hypothetical protein BK120_15820 [Paenibacillus sp. FSL A5-0031]|uniref:EpsG family protein n=1 Tax=Paenibacillus sp. FSL A5-0031 TaxID=1920420 RepID=UPI00096FC6FC|nr:EpsG family protein [Paenibacillus sp. FSL A5-0031]OME82138.1 hypothetical protein BK120_15820 [Paenibacillus sp. FSL A5-0031]
MNFIVSFPYSAIFYSGILFFCVIFSLLAQFSNRKLFARYMIMFVVLTLSIVAGLRGSMVGKDTWAYLQIIESTSISYSGELFYQYTEQGFQILIRLLMFVLNEPHYVLFSIALLTNSLIISTCWIFRERMNFALSVFCYITMFYFETYNISRQWLAIAIIFFAFRYLIRSKYGVFIAFIIIAFSIHNSAIICLLFIPIHMFFMKKLPIIYALIIILSLIFSGKILNITGISSTIENYGYYINEIGSTNGNFGLLFLARLGIFLFAIFLYLKNEYKYEDNIFQKQIIAVSFLGLLMSILGYMYMFAGRIATYATVFQILLFAMISRTKTFSFISILMIIILGIYLFYGGLNNSSQGQMPYKFFQY